MLVIAESLMALVMVRRSDAMTATSASIAIHAKSAHQARQPHEHVFHLNDITNAGLVSPAAHALVAKVKLRQRSLHLHDAMSIFSVTCECALNFQRGRPVGSEWTTC
jgi:hypothetical protein